MQLIKEFAIHEKIAFRCSKKIFRGIHLDSCYSIKEKDIVTTPLLRSVTPTNVRGSDAEPKDPVISRPRPKEPGPPYPGQQVETPTVQWLPAPE